MLTNFCFRQIVFCVSLFTSFSCHIYWKFMTPAFNFSQLIKLCQEKSIHWVWNALQARNTTHQKKKPKAIIRIEVCSTSLLCVLIIILKLLCYVYHGTDSRRHIEFSLKSQNTDERTLLISNVYTHTHCTCSIR